MFCSKCGAQLQEDAKFCPRCGTQIGERSTTSLSTAEEAPKQQGSKKRRWGTVFGSIVLAWVSASVAVVLLAQPGVGRAFSVTAWTIIGITFFIFGLLSYYLRRSKRWRKLGIILVVVVIAAGMALFTFILNRSSDEHTIETLGLLQDTAFDAAVIKSIGDEITRGGGGGRSLSEMADRANALSVQLDALDAPVALKDYASALEEWVTLMAVTQQAKGADPLFVRVAEANVSGPLAEKWARVPANPRPFTVRLSHGVAVGALNHSIEQLVSIKEFGEYAIAREDREVMRTIAARLQVQDHWLGGFVASQPEDICARSGCLRATRGIVPGVWRSALGVSYGEPTAKEQWIDSWAQAAEVIQPEDGWPEGISEGESGELAYSPTVQAFMDQCSGQGGIVGGTGGVQERLPTTEGGWTCWSQGKQCWDMLTYSGGRYMGGNAGVGCPELGLLPRSSTEPPEPPPIPLPPPSIEPTPQPPPSGESWDGVYSLTSSGSCTVQVPGLGATDIGTSVVPGQFEVRGNVIQTPSESIPINASGVAQASVNFGYGEALATYHFSSLPDGGVAVTSTATAGGSAEGVSVSCDIQASGNRVGS